jgi:predicted ATPase
MDETTQEKSPLLSKKLIAVLVGTLALGFLSWWAMQSARLAVVAEDGTTAAEFIETAQQAIKYAGYLLITFVGGQATVDTMVRRARERTAQARYADSLDPAEVQMPSELRR